MRRPGGFTLIEALFTMLLVGVTLNVLAVTTSAFYESYDRVVSAEADLEVATRLLADVREDLGGARRVEVRPAVLLLVLEGGAERRYDFDLFDGTVRRHGGGDERAYPRAFGAVRFDADEEGTVGVSLRLRKHDPAAALQPWISTRVFCRNRGK